jgi:hypothetical protein
LPAGKPLRAPSPTRTLWVTSTTAAHTAASIVTHPIAIIVYKTGTAALALTLALTSAATHAAAGIVADAIAIIVYKTSSHTGPLALAGTTTHTGSCIVTHSITIIVHKIVAGTQALARLLLTCPLSRLLTSTTRPLGISGWCQHDNGYKRNHDTCDDLRYDVFHHEPP